MMNSALGLMTGSRCCHAAYMRVRECKSTCPQPCMIVIVTCVAMKTWRAPGATLLQQVNNMVCIDPAC